MTTYSAAVLTDTPALYWVLDDANGTANPVDSSGNSRNASVSGALNPGLGQPSIFIGTGKSLGSDGTTGVGYVYRAYDASLDVGTGDFAVEFVIVCSNATGNYVEVFARDSTGFTGTGLLAYLNSADGALRIWMAGTAHNLTTRISDGIRHHVVIARSGTTVTVYLDNVVEATWTEAGSINSSSPPLRMVKADGSYPSINGSISNFAWYTHNLTAARVKAHWIAATSHKEIVADSPLAYWPMSERSGNFVDASGNGRDLVLSGGVALRSVTTGKFTDAPHWDGVNDYGSVAVDLSGASKVSFECWFRWDAFANDDHMLVEYTADGASNAGFYVDPNGSPGAFALASGPVPNENVTYTRPSAAAWHHLVVLVDRTLGGGSQIAIYLDNALYTTGRTVYNGNDITGNFANSTLYIGSRAGTSLFGAFYMRHAALFNTILSAGRITAHYNDPVVNGAITFPGISNFVPKWSVDTIGSRRMVFSGSSDFFGVPPDVAAFNANSPEATRAKYRLVLMDSGGQNQLAELDKAKIGSPSWVLNGIGSLSFTMATADPKAALITPPENEVQLWRNEKLIWWGVITKGSGNDKETTFQCQTLEWYFKRRTVGRMVKKNYLNNPSFEQGLAYWYMRYMPYSPAQYGPYFQVVNTPVVDGQRALEMWMDMDDHDCCAIQSLIWTVDVSTSPKGDEFALSAWIYVPSSSYVGPAIEGRGFHLERLSTTELSEDPFLASLGFPKSIQHEFIPIDENTPKDIWLWSEIALVSPPAAGVPEEIQVRLYPPDGHVIYDGLSLSRANESLTYVGQDQAYIFQHLITHLQDPAYGKSDLHIGSTGTLTGVPLDRQYFFSDHQYGYDIINEFASLARGFDWGIEFTPTQRTATMWFPNKGSRRSSVVFELGRNIATFTVDVDGDQTADSIAVLGEPLFSSISRQEYGATDASALNGLILETVFNATPNSNLQSLGGQATRALQRFKLPVRVPQITTMERSGALIGRLRTGDIHRLVINFGWVQVDEDYRIVSITLDPNTDTMQLAVNPASAVRVLT